MGTVLPLVRGRDADTILGGERGGGEGGKHSLTSFAPRELLAHITLPIMLERTRVCGRANHPPANPYMVKKKYTVFIIRTRFWPQFEI